MWPLSTMSSLARYKDTFSILVPTTPDPGSFLCDPKVFTSLIKRESKQSPQTSGVGECVVWHCHHTYPQNEKGKKQNIRSRAGDPCNDCGSQHFFSTGNKPFCRPPNCGHHDSYNLWVYVFFLQLRVLSIKISNDAFPGQIKTF